MFLEKWKRWHSFTVQTVVISIPLQTKMYPNQIVFANSLSQTVCPPCADSFSWECKEKRVHEAGVVPRNLVTHYLFPYVHLAVKLHWSANVDADIQNDHSGSLAQDVCRDNLCDQSWRYKCWLLKWGKMHPLTVKLIIKSSLASRWHCVPNTVLSL